MLRRLFHLAVLAAGGMIVWSVFLDADGSRRWGFPEIGSGERLRSRSTHLVPEKDVEPLSDLERSAKRDLEAQVRRQFRSDHVVTTDGRVLRGRVVAETETSIHLLQSFGGTGQMEMTLARSEVREIVRNSREAPPIRTRDVRFRLEFPDFNFYRRPPFTIVSDQDFFRIEDAVSLLEELHVECTRAFRDLIERPERDDGIQLLFFSDERQFDDYRRHYGSETSYASGFYSSAKDRLVVFDQKSSKWAKQAAGQAGVLMSVHSATGRSGDRAALKRWHRSTTRSIRAEAARANRAILRHEGAHQLFFSYGVHSQHGAEHPWLIEGLAEFCEGGVGSAHEQHAEKAGRRGRLWTFAELVNFTSREDFRGPDDDLRRKAGVGPDTGFAVAAYAQSWFIVRHLMQTHRDEFFEYIRFVRDPANRRELGMVPRFDLLSRFVGRTPEELERELQWEDSRL
jgi:hypothetical protein